MKTLYTSIIVILITGIIIANHEVLADNTDNVIIEDVKVQPYTANHL